MPDDCPSTTPGIRQDTVEFRQHVLRLLETIDERLAELDRKIEQVSRQLPRDGDRWTVLEEDRD